MVQEIITYLIVGAAVGVIAFKLFNVLKPQAKKVQQNNSQCSSCSTGCGLKHASAYKEKNALTFLE